MTMPSKWSCEYVTLADAAQIVGISPITLHRWAQAGRIWIETTQDGQYRLRRTDVLKLRVTGCDSPNSEA
jgi:predicted site-specific integrase-resolvase